MKCLKLNVPSSEMVFNLFTFYHHIYNSCFLGAKYTCNLQHYYRHTSRELKRLSNITLSPLYTHFSESIMGLATIRAYRQTDMWVKCMLNALICVLRQGYCFISVHITLWVSLNKICHEKKKWNILIVFLRCLSKLYFICYWHFSRFQEENQKYLTINQRAQFCTQAASRWLDLRLRMLGVAIVGAIAFIAVLQHHFQGVDPGQSPFL